MSDFDIDIDLLIREIENRPALYDTHIEEYNDRKLKEKLWIDICRVVVDDWNQLSNNDKALREREVQSKWKNLRTCFNRELHARMREPDGKKGKRKRKYLHFDQLSFLLPSTSIIDCNVATKKLPSSNLSSDDIQITEMSYPEVELDEEIEAAAVAVPRSSRRSKCKQQQSSKETSVKAVEDDLHIDADKFFLLSLLPQFKRFDDEQRFTAQMEILKLMRRIKLTRK